MEITVENHLNKLCERTTDSTTSLDNSIVKNQESQTSITFMQNETSHLNKYKSEFQRKLRYENHTNILIAHKTNNTVPKALHESSFPPALINTDIIIQKQ